MGVKRKASFTTIASPGTPCCSETIVTIDETPKHLHSRTRKRFRDDRPDDETVYGEIGPSAILLAGLHDSNPSNRTRKNYPLAILCPEEVGIIFLVLIR